VPILSLFRKLSKSDQKKLRMRYNEQEVASLLQSKTPDWEGRLSYKPPKSAASFGKNSQFKERYFKIIGNLLYCLRVCNTGERVTGADIVLVLVMEQFTVQEEYLGTETVHAFSVIFHQDDSQEEKHIFVADSSRSVVQWIEALRVASFETQREQLILLQIKLRNKTGVDPLRGTALQFNPVYCLQGSNNKCDVIPPDFSRLCSMERSQSDGAVNLPKPVPRKQKKNGISKSSNFVSHLGIEHWERLDEADGRCASPEGVNKSKPTFKSHVPEGNLIDF